MDNQQKLTQLIHVELGRYWEYTSTAELYDVWTNTFQDDKTKKKRALLDIRIAALNCIWSLLNRMERMIIQKTVIDGEGLESVLLSFNAFYFGGKQSLSKHMVQQMDKIAWEKILCFVREHSTILLAIFDTPVSTPGKLRVMETGAPVKSPAERQTTLE